MKKYNLNLHYAVSGTRHFYAEIEAESRDEAIRLLIENIFEYRKDLIYDDLDEDLTNYEFNN